MKSARSYILLATGALAAISLGYWLNHNEQSALYLITLGLLIAVLAIVSTSVNTLQYTMRGITLFLAMTIIIYPKAAFIILFSPVLYAFGAIIVDMLEDKQRKPETGLMQYQGFLLVFVLGIAGMYYKLLHMQRIEDTAALYIGLPFLLALGISLLPRSRSLVIATLKGITIALLLSSLVLNEGYICILFSAPIFYMVGAIVAYAIERIKKHRKSNLKTSMIATILALMSLEGVSGVTTIPRENTVSISKIIPANIHAVRQQLANKIQFTHGKPLFLSIFPYPADISGTGLQLGDIRTAKFVAYKHIWWTRVEGSLVMQVTQSSPDNIVFTPIKDDSYLSHYLTWQNSQVILSPVDDAHTRVTWILSYKRKLDPAWYFSPLEYYAVTLAAGELIDHAATPHS